MKNYCGKDCESCAVREAEACPGCRRVVDDGACEIASCCREKGHESCSTCTQRPWCPTVRKAVSMPKYRREKAEADEAAAIQLREQAGVMVKWCTPLFWLQLVMEAVGVLETIFENTPPVPFILNGMTILLYLVMTFCLVKLRPAADRYGKAALFTLLTAIFAGIPGFLPTENMVQALTVLISLPGAILSYLAVYHTYNAHADAVFQADWELADKWRSLWKWTILSLAGMFLAVPVAAVLGILGLLLLLVSMIAIVVCGVLELVYLHRMNGIFHWVLDEE